MTKPMKIGTAEALEAERILCAQSFAYFVKRAWRHIIPDPLQWSWHMDAICDHMQALSEGGIPSNRLLINVPPGASKSTLVGIMYSAWLWGPRGQPWHRYIGVAHEQGLAVRDNRLTRELVVSEWYQRLWPLHFKADQNEKLYFENDARGFRQACAVKSITGRRGHTIGIDDPLSPEKAYSETDRKTALRVMSETIPLRLNSPSTSAIVMVMQRLHEEDPAGYVLSEDLGYEHLCIPMEFEPERKCVTGIGWSDPRTDEGELMFPERFPADVVERDKRALGAYAYAGQMQQRPVPRGGGLFKREWFGTTGAAPAGTRWVRAWDLAATKDANAAWTAGVLMGRTPDGRYIIANAARIQGTANEAERLIVNTAAQDKATYGTVKGSLPQDPGQAGKSQSQYLVAQLAGHDYRASPESGDKITRAEPLSAQAEAGNVVLIEGSWNAEFLDEMCTFPFGKFNDQVDAASRAFMELAKPAQPKVLVGTYGHR